VLYTAFDGYLTVDEGTLVSAETVAALAVAGKGGVAHG
jgi:hypothetical protein